MGRFKTKFCWWPVRLARHVKDAPPDKPNMEFIGWVWMQRAYLTNNLNHGWVAFLDSKPMESRCKTCGQLLPPNLNSTTPPVA